MKKSLVFLIFFVVFFSGLSQQGNDIYQSSILLYSNNKYVDALHNFTKASNLFLKENDKIKYLQCQLYIVNIEAYKNNFQSAFTKINRSIKEYTSLGIKNDSIWGVLMNTKAMIYRLDGNSTAALVISDLILKEQLKKSGLPAYNLIRTYTERSQILSLLNKPDQSIAIIKKALEFSENTISTLEKAQLYDNLGSAYVHKDVFDQALIYYNKAHQLNIKNKARSQDLASTSFHLGIVSEYRGNYNKAIEYYKKSVYYIQQNQLEETLLISRAYTGLSNAYKHKNDIEKAEEYIEKALQKSRSVFDDGHFNMAHIYASYSRILKSSGRLEESIVFDKKTQIIREKSYGQYNRFSIQNLKSIARTQVTLKNYDEALSHYKEILRRTQVMKSKVQQAYVYGDLGNMYHIKKEYQKAVTYFDKTLWCLSEDFTTDSRQIISIELALAQSLINLGNNTRVLNIIHKHFKLNKNEDHNYPSLLLETINIYNTINLNIYEETGSLDGVKNSYEYAELLIECIRKVKKEYTGQRSQIKISNVNTNYFDKAIEVCYILFQNTKEQSYLKKAFELSEMNRNSILVAGIKDIQFKKMANIPDSFLQKEASIKKKLSEVKKALYKKQVSARVDTLMTLRVQYGLQLDSLLSEMEDKFPKYFQLKYTDKTTSITNLQNRYLSTDDVFIEYYLGEDNAYIFEIHSDKVGFRKLEKTATIRKQVEDYRKRMIRQKDIDQSSQLLFEMLLRECTLNKNIVLVTDGVLNYIPFETLQREQEYLIQKHTISYVGSATILQAQGEKNYNKKRNWIGFAPAYEAGSYLAASEQEITGIAELMKGKSFIGREASLRNFKKYANDFSIIHLAAHAKIDHQDPMFNHLLFSKDAVPSELTASEIYTLSMPSELVVLGACDTGFGKLEKGEGVMSMSRAFHYAGAKSTLMSLWKVPDKETAVLMTRFYRYLKKGYTKSNALKEAKLAYLNQTNDNTLKHPYYWAGFVISGNIDAIHNTDQSYWWIVFIVCLMILIVGYRKKLFQFFK